jgi:hypothetical protein
MATPPTDGKRDYRYSLTGIDLTAPLQLNPNPFDIESIGGRDKAYVVEKWKAFLRFVNSKIDKNDTSLNSQAGWESLTVNLIKEFNTSPDSNWVQFGGTNPNRGRQNPMTRDDIFAIQKFTNKVDPNAKIDGWLGTQTLRMDYPKTSTSIAYDVTKTYSPELLLPVIWGNKRYVISNKDNLIANEESKKPNSGNTSKPLSQYLKLYDPTIHSKDKFIFNPDTIREWTILSSSVAPSQSAEKINSETVKTAIKKQTQQLQTKLKSSF